MSTRGRGQLAEVLSEAVCAVVRGDHIDRADGDAELKEVVEPSVEELGRRDARAHELWRKARYLRRTAERAEGQLRHFAPRVDVGPADVEFPFAGVERVGAGTSRVRFVDGVGEIGRASCRERV